MLQRLVLFLCVWRKEMVDRHVGWCDEHRLEMGQHVEAVLTIVVADACGASSAERHRLDEQVDIDLIHRTAGTIARLTARRRTGQRANALNTRAQLRVPL